jgi:hypothetical protein
MTYATKRAMLALWLMGCYGDIMGQINDILLKNC